ENLKIIQQNYKKFWKEMKENEQKQTQQTFSPREIPKDVKEQIIYYHTETFHHEDRGARSFRKRDWANEPNRCRRYFGSPFYLLSRIEKTEWDKTPKYDDIFCVKQNAKQLNLQSISELFYYS